MRTERIAYKNEDNDENGSQDKKPYVVYIMKNAARINQNQALYVAINKANELDKKLIVISYLKKDAGKAKHQKFEIEGLKEAFKKLKKKNIKHIVFNKKHGHFEQGFKKKIAALVTERMYLREQKSLNSSLVKKISVPYFEVETSLVLPPECVSEKREYAARTIRPKIQKVYGDFIENLSLKPVKNSSLNSKVSGDLNLGLKTSTILEKMGFSKSESKESFKFKGGESQADKRVTSFIRSKLDDYSSARQEVFNKASSSDLSPYLRYGQISPIEIIRKVEKARAGNHKGRQAFVEELLVRRELAYNFVDYESKYDSFTSLPDWAKESLEKHDSDTRNPKYTKSEFEKAKTDDDLWNACMKTMKNEGYLHNALRMYWGKKILEWSSSSSHGYSIAIELNNKYFLDGNDPNSFTNVLWCYGLHDRAWGESKIYGKVRKYSKKNAIEKLGGEDGLEKFVKASENSD